MKSPIILATLFATSLAAGPLPGVDILPTLPLRCAVADIAIKIGVAYFEPQLRGVPRIDEAIKAGVAAFKHKIGCGPAPPEPQDPPELVDCRGPMDNATKKGPAKLKEAFDSIGSGMPPKFEEGVKEAIRVFRKTVGCKEKADVVVRD